MKINKKNCIEEINSDSAEISIDTMLSSYHDSKQWYKKIYYNIDFFIFRYFINPIKDFKYWCKDTIYLLKHKQKRQSYWSIDDTLLDVLLHNIPILKNKKHTLSWKMLDKAILEEYKDKKNFNLKEYYKNHYTGFGKKIEDRSVELEHALFDELILTIQKYKYYAYDYDFINIDKETDLELIEIDKKFRNTIPLIKGTHDKISFKNIDYNKLNKLADKQWKRIWEIVSIYGREFND